MPPRDWDAATYERIAAPLTAMGSDVLDRLVLAGDETVLDAGCGTGNVTRLLLERLPRGRVIAVDAAPSMVEQARELLPAGTDVRQADLLELELGEPVDAVLSTATFHWVPRPRPAVPQPPRRRWCRAGGSSPSAAASATSPRSRPPGSTSRPRRPTPSTSPAGRPTGRSPRPRTPSGGCELAGFSDVWCWLTRVDVDPGDPAAYLRAICLGSFLDRLPEALREPFVAAALERLPDPLQIHYVRLNILARA